MKKSGGRPLGITILGWFYLIVGGINFAYVIFGSAWNLFLGPGTKTYWDVSQPVGTFVLLTSYIIIGIGIMKLNKAAYIISLVLSALFLVGSIMWLADLLHYKDSVQTAIAAVCMVISILIPAYLMSKRRYFFKS